MSDCDDWDAYGAEDNEDWEMSNDQPDQMIKSGNGAQVKVLEAS